MRWLPLVWVVLHIAEICPVAPMLPLGHPPPNGPLNPPPPPGSPFPPPPPYPPYPPGSALIHNFSITYSRCPGEFTAVTQQDDDRNILLGNSNCAMPCRSPMWTPYQWRVYSIVASIFAALGFVTSLASALSRLTHPKYCFQTNALILLISSCVLSLTNFIVSLLGSSNQCHNDTMPLESIDGPSACATQSIIVLYAFLVGCLAWSIQATNLMIKVVYDRDISKVHETINTVVIFGLPVISVVYVLVTGSYGFSGIVPWCGPTSGDFRLNENRYSADLTAFYVPAGIIIVIGLVMLGPICGTVVSTVTETLRIESEKSLKLSSNKSSASNGSWRPSLILTSSRVAPTLAATHLEEDEDATSVASTSALCCQGPCIQIVRTPLVFCLPFLVFWVSLFALRIKLEDMQHDDKYDNSVKAWWSCIEVNYDGVNDASWESICGARPKEGISFSVMVWITICFYGQSLFVTMIHPPLIKLTDLISYLKAKTKPPSPKHRHYVKNNANDNDLLASLASKFVGFGVSLGPPAPPVSQRERGATSYHAVDGQKYSDMDLEKDPSSVNRTGGNQETKRLFSFMRLVNAPVVPINSEISVVRNNEVAPTNSGVYRLDSPGEPVMSRHGSNDEIDAHPNSNLHPHASHSGSIRLEPIASRRIKPQPKTSGKGAGPKEQVHSEFEQDGSEGEANLEIFVGTKSKSEQPNSSVNQDYLGPDTAAPTPSASRPPLFGRRLSSDSDPRSASMTGIAGLRPRSAITKGDSSKSHVSFQSTPSGDAFVKSRDEVDLVHMASSSGKSELMLSLVDD